jgi:predicted DCC family thiol-disulfide oxidoreductase YuxK
VDIRPWQQSRELMAEHGLTAEDGMTQIWYIDIDTNSVTLSGGAEAANDAMRFVWWAKPFTYFYYLPGIRQLQDWIYRWVADNRHRMPGSTAACEIEPKETTRGNS